VAAEDAFDLVFVVFNTFFAVLTQNEQVRCFSNVAARLNPGGAFVVQAFVPDLSRFDRGQRVQTLDLGLDHVAIDASRLDPVAQTIATQKLLVSGGATHLLPVFLRYAWPAELDLMARLAGLRLRERYESFERQPFTAESTGHVSVYAT
jgi:hypothetical protein